MSYELKERKQNGRCFDVDDGSAVLGK